MKIGLKWAYRRNLCSIYVFYSQGKNEGLSALAWQSEYYFNHFAIDAVIMIHGGRSQNQWNEFNFFIKIDYIETKF